MTRSARSNPKHLCTFAAGALALTLATAACGGGSGSGSTSKDAPVVAFMMSENVNARWQKDAARFESGLKAAIPDAQVLKLNANNDAGLQQSQFETALTKGADVVVLVAVDSDAAAKMANTGAAQGVPVIAFDHMINKTDKVAAYVSPDGIKQGKIIGQWVAENSSPGDKIAIVNGSPTDNNAHLYHDGFMSVLQPEFDSGKLTKVAEDWVKGWDPQAAQRTVEQMLTKTSNGINTILIPWDDGAGVAAAAVASQKLTGKIKITGGDGTAAALNRMLLGSQNMTVQRDDLKETDLAVQATVGLINDKAVPKAIITGTINNGTAEIPSVLLEPVAVGVDDVDGLIESGWVTKTVACEGVPAGTGPC